MAILAIASGFERPICSHRLFVVLDILLCKLFGFRQAFVLKHQVAHLEFRSKTMSRDALKWYQLQSLAKMSSLQSFTPVCLKEVGLDKVQKLTNGLAIFRVALKVLNPSEQGRARGGSKGCE